MKEIITAYINEEILGGAQAVEVNAEDDLLGSGLLDSLGMMALVAFIEQRFNTKIPPQDMTIENFQTIQSISNYLRKRDVA